MALATTTMPAPAAPICNKRKPATAGLSAGGRAVKRRAAQACQCCRTRKVRCDVVESGIPCTNCRLDEVECQVTEGKRRKKSCLESDFLQTTSPTTSHEEAEEVSQFALFDDIDGLQDLSLPTKQNSNVELKSSQHKPHMLYQTQGYKITPEERQRRLSILTQRNIPVQSPAILTSPYFPASSLQNEVKLPRFVPPLPQRLLSDDIDYLQKKGAFLIPEPSLRNELLRNYVQYVQPFLPLIELTDFLDAIHKNDGSSTVSLLLFQAVMFAATAFIDMRYLAAQGYESRKAARKAFFQRIKLLYDFDYETDRVTVVQSVLVMTYWYENPDDPKDVWHWLGVAISLARTIGLNVSTRQSPLSVQKQKLWKRVWWCCYMRDRLISIGMRRPIRIREDEFDVPVLELSDFETDALPHELARMVGGSSAIRDPAKRQLLARMCIQMIRICRCITHVLEVQYSMLGHRLGATAETTMRLVPKRSAAEPCTVMRCDDELEAWYSELPTDLRYFSSLEPREKNVLNDGEVINIHRALITGVYLTASSALHRPQMMPAMPNLVIETELKQLSKTRVYEAASAITDIFRDFYTHDLIRYLPNTGVTILLPAMIVHLLDIKSTDSTTRQLSVRRFHFCMQALQKLRDIYASADFAFLFLDTAVRKADISMSEGGQSSTAQQKVDNRSETTLRASTSNLTPPPDTAQNKSNGSHPNMHHSASTTGHPVSASKDMSSFEARRDSFAALSPPSSDRSTSTMEQRRPDGAAITLSDMNLKMYHDSGSSNEAYLHDTGYVDASSFMDLNHDPHEHAIDEEAMQSDFDQLINLEGHVSTGMDSFTLENIMEEQEIEGPTDWLAPTTKRTGSVSSMFPQQEEEDTERISQLGLIIPADAPDENNDTNELDAATTSIDMLRKETEHLRNGITNNVVY